MKMYLFQSSECVDMIEFANQEFLDKIRPLYLADNDMLPLLYWSPFIKSIDLTQDPSKNDIYKLDISVKDCQISAFVNVEFVKLFFTDIQL